MLLYLQKYFLQNMIKHATFNKNRLKKLLDCKVTKRFIETANQNITSMQVSENAIFKNNYQFDKCCLNIIFPIFTS